MLKTGLEDAVAGSIPYRNYEGEEGRMTTAANEYIKLVNMRVAVVLNCIRSSVVFEGSAVQEVLIQNGKPAA